MLARNLIAAFTLSLLTPSLALAQAPTEAPAETPSEAPSEAPSPAPAPAPAPYSLPFQLRPAVALNLVRSDTMLAMRETGTTVVQMLLASYKIAPELSLIARQGWLTDSPDTGPSGSAFSNLALGINWVPKLGDDLRLVPFLGVALPIGQGGGNSPDPAKAAAIGSGIYARAAMDNAMFARNDLVIFPGIGLAYVADGLTVHAEATVLELIRVRGENKQPEADKTNFTAGLHVGYFVIPQFSVGAELRHQRWLKGPLAVDKNPAMRDATTVAGGVRAHFKVGDVWVRPGVSYSHPIDNPMADASYKLVQLDIPVVF